MLYLIAVSHRAQNLKLNGFTDLLNTDFSSYKCVSYCDMSTGRGGGGGF